MFCMDRATSIHPFRLLCCPCEALPCPCPRCWLRPIGDKRNSSAGIRPLVAAQSPAGHLRAIHDYRRAVRDYRRRPLCAFRAGDLAPCRSYGADCRGRPSSCLDHAASGTGRPFASSAVVGDHADGLIATCDCAEFCQSAAGAMGTRPELCRTVAQAAGAPGRRCLIEPAAQLCRL